MPLSLKNIQLPTGRAYRTGSEYEPYGFFLEGAVNSTQFDFPQVIYVNMNTSFIFLNLLIQNLIN